MKKFLSANEAVAHAAAQAGCVVASAYPGTPSTEILENIAKFKDTVRCEWAVNEKVAMETAIGVAVLPRLRHRRGEGRVKGRRKASGVRASVGARPQERAPNCAIDPPRSQQCPAELPRCVVRALGRQGLLSSGLAAEQPRQ